MMTATFQIILLVCKLRHEHMDKIKFTDNFQCRIPIQNLIETNFVSEMKHAEGWTDI